MGLFNFGKKKQSAMENSPNMAGSDSNLSSNSSLGEMPPLADIPLADIPMDATFSNDSPSSQNNISTDLELGPIPTPQIPDDMPMPPPPPTMSSLDSLDVPPSDLSLDSVPLPEEDPLPIPSLPSDNSISLPVMDEPSIPSETISNIPDVSSPIVNSLETSSMNSSDNLQNNFQEPSLPSDNSDDEPAPSFESLPDFSEEDFSEHIEKSPIQEGVNHLKSHIDETGIFVSKPSYVSLLGSLNDSSKITTDLVSKQKKIIDLDNSMKKLFDDQASSFESLHKEILAVMPLISKK